MFRLQYHFLAILLLPCLLLLCNPVNAQITRSATSQESLSSSAEAPAGASGAPAVAPNGRFLVFESEAANLVANDSNKSIDIYLKDLTTGTITRQSVSSAGTEANSASSNPSISPVLQRVFLRWRFRPWPLT